MWKGAALILNKKATLKNKRPTTTDPCVNRSVGPTPVNRIPRSSKFVVPVKP